MYVGVGVYVECGRMCVGGFICVCGYMRVCVHRHLGLDTPLFAWEGALSIPFLWDDFFNAPVDDGLWG